MKSYVGETHQQTVVNGILKEVLKENFKKFYVEEVELKENDVQSSLSFVLKSSFDTPQKINCSESENGFVDALFKSIVRVLLERSENKFLSLKQIKFFDFNVGSKLTTRELEKAGPLETTEKEAYAKLTVTNESGYHFRFTAKSFSIVHASIDVVIKAIEFFVNSEMAFIVLHRCVLDAKKRGRHQLAEKYVMQMSELVKVCCYADIKK